MKRMLALILLMLFGLVGLAYGQSAKEVYEAVKEADLKATGSQRDFDNAVAAARAKFDLFKDSKEAEKSPKFTKYIENALVTLREAQFVSKNPGDWKKCMDKVDKELEKAEKFLK